MSGEAIGQTLVLDAVDGFANARNLAMSTRAEVSVRRWNPRSPDGFNVAEITPLTKVTDEVVIYPMSYDYRIDPLVLRRLEVISIITRRRVVLVDTPGVTMNFENPQLTQSSRVRAGVFWAAVRGNFGPLADLQWQAIEQCVDVSRSRIRLLGESLGAQSVMSMARFISAASIDLVEPVNCQSYGLAAMLRVGRSLIRVEEPLRAAHVARSRAQGWTLPDIFEKSSAANKSADARFKKFHVQGRWAVASALAMTRGLAREIDHLGPQTPVVVWRAADSTASDPASAMRFVDLARAQTGRAELVTVRLEASPAGHHFLTDLDAATGFGTELSRRWNREL